ncbi:MAG: putative concanavalin A-like lectin/glucanases superfamily protein [Prokaryotic dsDNA virus sp.]|nr:MAG: putative concanavalin A-like lectin/glucanases superfamily protein [Prokaryotic dsDNA virus sp.]|tara:strand:- start:3683 stop:4414 length:732 start_codon:yes stop_codon:yes gene_type:complete
MLRSTTGILARRQTSVLTNSWSIDIDGASQYVTCGNVTATNGVSNASWSFWFKLDSNSINQMAISQWNNSSATNQMYVYLIGSSRIDVHLAGVVALRDNSTVSLSTGTWYHFAAVYDGSLTGSNICKAWLNGTPLTNSIAPTSISNLKTVTNDFEMGRRPTGNYFDGKIDEVAIYTSSLTPTNVASIYNSGTPTDLTTSGISGLAHYWRNGDNDGGSGTTVTDQQGSKNGTLTNSASFISDAP